MERICEDCGRIERPSEQFNQAFEGDGDKIWLCDDCLGKQDELLDMLLE